MSLIKTTRAAAVAHWLRHCACDHDVAEAVFFLDGCGKQKRRCAETSAHIEDGEVVLN